jgi:hypothetical protein
MIERSRSTRQQDCGADPERRRFLWLAGAAPLLWCGVWALAGCDRRETNRNPYADQRSPEAPESPPAAGPAAGEAGGPAGGGESLVTEVPAMKPTVEALQYVNQSAKADQRCANCQMFTARTQTRGKCQLFSQGLVSSQGWCTSWVAKVAS